jgi:hypothetical protein
MWFLGSSHMYTQILGSWTASRINLKQDKGRFRNRLAERKVIRNILPRWWQCYWRALAVTLGNRHTLAVDYLCMPHSRFGLRREHHMVPSLVLMPPVWLPKCPTPKSGNNLEFLTLHLPFGHHISPLQPTPFKDVLFIHIVYIQFRSHPFYFNRGETSDLSLWFLGFFFFNPLW